MKFIEKYFKFYETYFVPAPEGETDAEREDREELEELERQTRERGERWWNNSSHKFGGNYRVTVRNTQLALKDDTSSLANYLHASDAMGDIKALLPEYNVSDSKMYSIKGNDPRAAKKVYITFLTVFGQRVTLERLENGDYKARYNEVASSKNPSGQPIIEIYGEDSEEVPDAQRMPPLEKALRGIWIYLIVRKIKVRFDKLITKKELYGGKYWGDRKSLSEIIALEGTVMELTSEQEEKYNEIIDSLSTILNPIGLLVSKVFDNGYGIKINLNLTAMPDSLLSNIINDTINGAKKKSVETGTFMNNETLQNKVYDKLELYISNIISNTKISPRNPKEAVRLVLKRIELFFNQKNDTVTNKKAAIISGLITNYCNQALAMHAEENDEADNLKALYNAIIKSKEKSYLFYLIKNKMMDSLWTKLTSVNNEDRMNALADLYEED